MLRSSSILFASKVIGFGIRILLPIFLVRILSKAEIGAYNQFFLLEILILATFQMGVNQSLYFFIPRNPENSGGYFINSLILNILLFTTCYTFIGFFKAQMSSWLGLPVLNEFFWYLAPFSLLMVFTASAQAFMTARRLFAQAAAFEILCQLLASIATLIAAALTRDLVVIIRALILSRVVSVFFGMGYIHFRNKGFKSSEYFKGIRPQFRYGIVLGLGGSLGIILMRVHEVTVSKFFDIDTYAVYSQGLKQIPIIMFFAQSISAVALVTFAQLVKKEQWQEVRNSWNEILGSLYAVGIPTTILLVALARPLVVLMYTDKYIEAVPIFQINALAMLFHLLNPTIVLRAIDRNDITLKIHVATLVVLPVGLYLGMKTFGLVGIIGVHAVMLVGNRLVQHTILNRLIPEPLPYFPPVATVLGFYRKAYRKGLSLISRRPAAN